MKLNYTVFTRYQSLSEFVINRYKVTEMDRIIVP